MRGHGTASHLDFGSFGRIQVQRELVLGPIHRRVVVFLRNRFGLPAYRYTCDHERDPKAISPVTGLWRPENEHLHQVGNDRITGVASNFGHVQAGKDQGGPSFLTTKTAKGVYAGGFGYITVWGDDPEHHVSR